MTYANVDRHQSAGYGFRIKGYNIVLKAILSFSTVTGLQ
jgi:hypothetical protein